MPVTFSHSRLSSFEDCPRKYEYRYVLRIPRDTDSIEAFVGKRVHEVLERLYLAVDRGQVPTLRQVLHRYGALFDEHYDAERVRVVRVETPIAEYRANGERGLTNYYRRHYPFDADETLAVEQRIAFDLDDSGRYRIQGFIDRVSRTRDGSIEIHDYKTGKWVPTQKAIDKDRQLAFYQIGVAEKYGSDSPVRLVWHYVARNQTRTSQRTPEQLDTLRSDTVDLIDGIQATEQFEPRTGTLCSWCEYNDICPAMTGSAAADSAAREAATQAKRGGAAPAPDEAPPGGRQLSFL
jgi:putative RecB family exonuclease